MNKRLDKKRQKRQADTPATTAETVKQPETDVNFYIQYKNQEYLEEEIIDKIKNKCQEQGIAIPDIKTLSIYLKPEEQKAYYTINEDGSGFIQL